MDLKDKNKYVKEKVNGFFKKCYHTIYRNNGN